MKTDQTESSNGFKESGQLETINVGIELTEKSFDLLTRDIYPHPISAIIRELICNGWDAQQVNKNYSDPIYVQLPTEVKPQLIIQDFGCGMSYEKLSGMYSVLFRSDKNNTNSQVGMLGIGAKTPYAYGGRSFIVETICDGLKSKVNPTIENGKPVFKVIYKNRPTDEKSGTKVTLSIHPEDLKDFYQSYGAIAPWFKNPSVECNFDRHNHGRYPFEKVDIIDSIDGHSIVKSNAPFYQDHKVYVEMGNVVYTVDTFNTAGVRVEYSDFNNLMNLASIVLKIDDLDNSYSLVLHAEIGDIRFQPNRENLTYNEITCKWIRSKITEVTALFKKRLNEMVVEDVEQFKKPGEKNIVNAYFRYIRDLSVTRENKSIGNYVNKCFRNAKLKFDENSDPMTYDEYKHSQVDPILYPYYKELEKEYSLLLSQVFSVNDEPTFNEGNKHLTYYTYGNKTTPSMIEHRHFVLFSKNMTVNDYSSEFYSLVDCVHLGVPMYVYNIDKKTNYYKSLNLAWFKEVRDNLPTRNIEDYGIHPDFGFKKVISISDFLSHKLLIKDRDDDNIIIELYKKLGGKIVEIKSSDLYKRYEPQKVKIQKVVKRENPLFNGYCLDLRTGRLNSSIGRRSTYHPRYDDIISSASDPVKPEKIAYMKWSHREYRLAWLYGEMFYNSGWNSDYYQTSAETFRNVLTIAGYNPDDFGHLYLMIHSEIDKFEKFVGGSNVETVRLDTPEIEDKLYKKSCDVISDYSLINNLKDDVTDYLDSDVLDILLTVEDEYKNKMVNIPGFDQNFVNSLFDIKNVNNNVDTFVWEHCNGSYNRIYEWIDSHPELGLDTNNLDKRIKLNDDQKDFLRTLNYIDTVSFRYRGRGMKTNDELKEIENETKIYLIKKEINSFTTK